MLGKSEQGLTSYCGRTCPRKQGPRPRILKVFGSTEVALPWHPQSRQDRKGNILSAMWKPTQTRTNHHSPTPNPEPLLAPRRCSPHLKQPRPAASSVGEQATIGKGLFIKGEITGSESLFIDGKVEGSISIPGNRVTVGRNGQVTASINAREIVVLGKVQGQCRRHRSRRHPRGRRPHRRRGRGPHQH